ncbi:MAG: hypothetical protein GY853_05475 [PVC group bacterium]|nr:hypothetical protein [PVC group bacterium]
MRNYSLNVFRNSYIALLLLLLFPSKAFACITCIFKMLDAVVPFYKNWMLVFFVWLVVFLTIKIFTKQFTKKIFFNYLKGILLLFVSIAFHPLFPIYLITLFVLWVRSYSKCYKRVKINELLIDDKAFLMVNHITVVALIIAAFLR